MPVAADDLAKTTIRKRMSAKPAVRSGRPPRELAGEVDERILDAAAKVFLERGFDGASIDEIAEVAHAGKPTIYARFANKRALFTAVVMRIVAQIEHFQSDVPTEATIEERLADLARAVALVQPRHDGDGAADGEDEGGDGEERDQGVHRLFFSGILAMREPSPPP